MKPLKCALTTLAVFISINAGAQITLDECIENAFSNYPQIKEKELTQASEGFDLKNASLAWVPQLSISAKATWQSEVVEMPFSMPGMDFNIPHDQYGITADITQQIWDGGAAAAKTLQAKTGAEVKRKQLEVNMYTIRSKVQSVYLGIILIDKQLELNAVLEEDLNRSLNEVRTLVEGGIKWESDIDQIRVNILSCEQQKTGLQTDRTAYIRMLSLLTGQDLTGQTFVEPQIEATTSMEIKRPELGLYDAQSQQVAAQKKQLDASLWPRFNFTVQAGYGRPSLNMLSGEFNPYVIAGVKMQWNLGSLYTFKNDRRKTELDSRKLDYARESFILNTSVEAIQKQSQVEKDIDILQKDEEIVKLRKSIRETGENQYKEGVLKMNDYLSLLDEEFKARLNNDVHKVQYIMDVLDRNYTLGK